MKLPILLIKAVTFLSLFLFISSPLSAQQIKKGYEFDSLKKQLVRDGFDKAKINQLFASKDIFFNPEGVSRFFIHTESSLNYDQFTSKKSIKAAYFCDLLIPIKFLMESAFLDFKYIMGTLYQNSGLSCIDKKI